MKFFFPLFFAMIFCESLIAQSSDSESLPNIIFILADDMGYGDIRYLNENSKIPTPHLDRIGQEGIIFSDAHSPSAVCTPTRYGLLTGRYAFRTRMKKGVLVGHSPSLIEPNRMTLASLLKQKDYVSACIGKWHLGLDWQKKDENLPLYSGGNNWDIKNTSNVDYKASVGGGPTDHGFDYSFIIPASLDIAPYCYIQNKKVTAPIVEHIEGSNAKRGVFWRHGDRAEDLQLDSVLSDFRNEAIHFIEKNHEKPFFLYLPLSAPHTPWLPIPAVKGRSEAGDYGDFVVQVDDLVGTILGRLDDLNISQNTLIVFSSDNGSHWKPSDQEQFEHQANYQFRGMKSDVWEGGHRVPFLARWPQKIQAGAKSDEMICLTDMMATFAELLDLEVPKNAGEDSYNVLPALLQESYESPLKEATILHGINGMFAIRKGEWKFIDGRGSGGWTYKGIEEEPPGQLYNMEKDPGEKQNLFLENPEKVAELKKLLAEIKNQD